MTHRVDAYGAELKVRDVWVVILLTVVTLGIYAFFWYFFINRELRDFGRAYQDPELSKGNPTNSVLAVTLGALLIVPPIVSYWRCTGRIRRAQTIVGAELTNGWIIFACYLGSVFLLLPGLAIPGYVQSGLNSVWGRFARIPDQIPAPPSQLPAQTTAVRAPSTAPDPVAAGAGSASEAKVPSTPSPPSSAPPAGWYEDPSRAKRLRYWNGIAWTDHTMD